MRRFAAVRADNILAVAASGTEWRHGGPAFPAQERPLRPSPLAREAARARRRRRPLAPYAKVAESVTGVAVIPVSVAQLAVSLGEYALDEDGDVGREAAVHSRR